MGNACSGKKGAKLAESEGTGQGQDVTADSENINNVDQNLVRGSAAGSVNKSVDRSIIVSPGADGRDDANGVSNDTTNTGGIRTLDDIKILSPTDGNTEINHADYVSTTSQDGIADRSVSRSKEPTSGKSSSHTPEKSQSQSQSQIENDFFLPNGVVKPVIFPRKTVIRTVEGSKFTTRNLGYKKSGEKVPSGPCLYDLWGFDMCKAEGKRVLNICNLFEKELMPKLPTKKGWREEFGIPEILIFNCQTPYESGRMWGSHPESDLGYNVIGYYMPSDATIEAFTAHQDKGKALPPALELFKRFVAVGKSERDGISLKSICLVDNIEELSVPGFISGYNGKPVLVTASCKVVKDKYPRILELDYDLRQWSYAARSSLPGTIVPRMKTAKMNMGWLIEGKTDLELPEQMLAGVYVENLDVINDLHVEKGR